MTLKTVLNKVIVEPVEAETVTKGGIIIPDTAQEKPQKGTVIATGKGKADEPMEVKAGDTVEIKEKCKSSQRYKDILETTGGRLVPDWLDADAENLKATVKELPAREAIDVPVDEMLIVELYSK